MPDVAQMNVHVRGPPVSLGSYANRDPRIQCLLGSGGEDGQFLPQLTSYDYDAPISEAGASGQPGIGGPNKFQARPMLPELPQLAGGPVFHHNDIFSNAAFSAGHGRGSQSWQAILPLQALSEQSLHIAIAGKMMTSCVKLCVWCCAADPERHQQPHWQSPTRSASFPAYCILWCNLLQRVWQPAGRPATIVPWGWHTGLQASLHGVLWAAVSPLCACMPATWPA